MNALDSRVRTLTWTLMGLAASALIGSLLLGVVVVAQIRSSQVARAPKTDATLAAIRDCTEPTGECFKRGQERTAEVVGQIGAGNILAVVCALQVENGTPLNQALEQVTQCVARKLRATP